MSDAREVAWTTEGDDATDGETSGLPVAFDPDEPAHVKNAPAELAQLAWQARAIARSVTLPRALQEKPADILAVMLAGRELGLGPMASTRMVHVINGQTSIATELKLKLALRAGHEVVALAEGPGWCVAHCRNHPLAGVFGWAMDVETAGATAVTDVPILPTEFTIASAIRQGNGLLVDKDNWRNYQRSMLFWRAAGDFMRRHCPGVGGGLYTLEELGGDDD